MLFKVTMIFLKRVSAVLIVVGLSCALGVVWIPAMVAGFIWQWVVVGFEDGQAFSMIAGKRLRNIVRYAAEL